MWFRFIAALGLVAICGRVGHADEPPQTDRVDIAPLLRDPVQLAAWLHHRSPELAAEPPSLRLASMYDHRLSLNSRQEEWFMFMSSEDIAELANGFVQLFASQVKKPVVGISSAAIAALCRYHFPGNVRELRNMIQRAVILTSSTTIEASDIALPLLAPAAVAMLPTQGDEFFHVSLRSDGKPYALGDIERAYVARVLAYCGGHRTAAAAALDISYPTFLKRLRELKLD
jgi:hypothetical protein